MKKNYDKDLVLYNYVDSLINLDLKKLDELIDDNILVNLVNSDTIYDKNSYIEYVNNELMDKQIKIERCTPFLNQGLSVLSLEGKKIVSFYEFDLESKKVIKLEEYWFKVF